MMPNLLYKDFVRLQQTSCMSSDTTVHCIQFIACTCQISEGAKRKILRGYKSSKQNKKEINEKEEILCWTRTQKKKRQLCLERFCHYYNNVKNKKRDCKDLYSCITCFQNKSKGRARLHIFCLVFGQLPH